MEALVPSGTSPKVASRDHLLVQGMRQREPRPQPKTGTLLDLYQGNPLAEFNENGMNKKVQWQHRTQSLEKGNALEKVVLHFAQWKQYMHIYLYLLAGFDGVKNSSSG